MPEMTLADVPAGCGVISKLTSDDGDFRITWNPDDPEQVGNARQAFADLRRDGYRLYRIRPARRGREPDREMVTAFDPDERQFVAVRANRGG